MLDDLKMDTNGAFYTAFKASRARDLVRRLELCYTPKHDTQLKIAEYELSAHTRHCLSDRPTAKSGHSETRLHRDRSR